MKKTTSPIRRALAAIAIAVLVAAAGGGFWIYQRLTGSLALLDGEHVLAGLYAAVTIERDALGVPTIRGADRRDVARATGFVHAQERFFQMDLLRRTAAGELAALFGEAALSADRTLRMHRFRARARAVLEDLTAPDRALIETYAAGVNAGLAALDAPPFEYLLLREPPLPWRPEDTALVVFAMYLDLQDEQWPRESTRGLLHDLLPPALAGFLDPSGSEWDAPLQGGPFATPPIPGPEVFDLRSQPPLEAQPPDSAMVRHFHAGSNNWAVAGNHTVHGGALLANDMHLGLRVPNIWYRASLAFTDDAGHERRVTGVTLPGTPAIIAGSNGQVAWGFTNSEGDWADLVVLEPAPNGGYLTAEGPKLYQTHREVIRVRDGQERELEILETVWGPVIDRDHRGRQRALRWVAHDPEAINLTLLHLETAATVEEALQFANRAGAPAQNFVVADSRGRVGWTISGPIPKRFGHAGRVPQSWADGHRGWDGWLAPESYPRIVDPPHGRLWSANNRLVAGPDLQRLGDSGYALGARARQIRDALFAIPKADEAAMLALQLDDRALFLNRWRELLLEVLTGEALADPERRTLRQVLENWSGRAGIDAAGYRLVREFHDALAARVFGPLTAACSAADPRFDYGSITQYEGPLWRLVQERPPHLLDPRYPTWPALFLDTLDTLVEEDASSLTWGQRNVSRIRHPFSQFLPALERWLDMPAVPLPGDIDMPRVQRPSAGASERMVVSPGREAEGIFHMPGGQSGHPLSPHYRAGHDAWVKGAPTPFLPGPAEHVLRLVPEAQAGPGSATDRP